MAAVRRDLLYVQVFYYYPTNIGIARGTLSVATLVVVSDGVDLSVALRFSYH